MSGGSVSGILSTVVSGLMVFGSGCEPSHRPSARNLEIGGVTVRAELAATPEQRARGLQGRSRLGMNEGMLFTFPRPVEDAFWMRDVLLPLSIAFFNPDGVVLSIQEMAPDGGQKLYRSPLPYQYALEMNQGWFEKNRVRVGDRLDLSGIGALKK